MLEAYQIEFLEKLRKEEELKRVGQRIQLPIPKPSDDRQDRK
jgi:hypothetical protein